MEEKRSAQANFGAHLFAGVGEMSGDGSDLNLDSPGDAANAAVEKLKDKEQSIKYVVNGMHPHGFNSHAVHSMNASSASNASSTLNGLNGKLILDSGMMRD